MEEEEGQVICSRFICWRKDDGEKKTTIVRQLLCAFVINLVSLLQGASVSSSSIILHELQNSSSHDQDNHCHHGENCTSQNSITIAPFAVLEDFHITQEEGSWIASSWVLGHLVSAMFAGFISDMIGRKRSLQLDTAVFFLGFLILTTGHLPTCLIIARLLLGYPLVSQVFLCEILDTNRRGLGAAMYSVLHSLGFCMVLFSGAFIPWRMAIFIPTLMCLPILALVTILHESPDWLIRRGRIEEYNKSMNFYQKLEDPEDFKLNLSKSALENETKNKNKEETKSKKEIFLNKFVEVSGLLFAQDKTFWRLVALLSLLFACVGWCGFSILSFYATEIFSKSGSPFSAAHTSWITSVTKIICAMGSFYVLHRFQRRTLLLCTSILVFLSFMTMSVYTFVVQQVCMSDDTISRINFIPMVSVIVAYVGYGLGYGVIPSLMAAEMMPVDVRSTAVGFFMTIEMTSTFLLSKLKPILMESLQIYGLFAMFAGTVAAVICITIAFKHKK